MEDVRSEKYRIGVIGCGGFGLYALQHFAQHPRLELAAMAGTHRDAAYAVSRRFGIPEPMEVDELCAVEDIQIVYIATPPFLHYDQAMTALNAGKHVICEKPLAMTMSQGEEMVAAARDRHLLLVANLMQRYNHVFAAVRALIKSRVLGEPLHGYFENYASDEGLPLDHWFWDREKSGGIFIEHGVHFFDMFAGWLGQGEVESAQAAKRPGTDIEDQVQCSVRYGEDVLINFYHGFTQPDRMDRQELRLVFELGDVLLRNWVPTEVNIHAVVDEARTRHLMDLFPGARLDILCNYRPKDRAATGRHKELDIYQKIELHYGEGDDKMRRYGKLLRDLVTDQIQWLRDTTHVRRITAQNGLDSLAMACRAEQLAHAGTQKE